MSEDRPNTTANAAVRWVLRTPEIRQAQLRHSRQTVLLPALLAVVLLPLLPDDMPWALAALTFAMSGAIAGCLGVSVGFHRHFAHRAFRAKPWLRAVMAIAGQTAGQGPVIYWTALHRRHHSFSDQLGDPHSPRAAAQDKPRHPWQAFWYAHVGWATDHAVPMPTRYAADLRTDPLVSRINEAYLWCLLAGLLLPTLIGLVWTGTWQGALVGFYFGGVLRMVASTQFIWAINSVCHTFGSRPHDTGDFSTNCAWMAPLSFGECWHNNHHHRPTHARFGHGWSQPDPGWWTIQTLRFFGQVWGVLEDGVDAQARDPLTDAAPPKVFEERIT
jgi:stearoyl-CoA desaturase (delta-9 desaturase)